MINENIKKNKCRLITLFLTFSSIIFAPIQSHALNGNDQLFLFSEKFSQRFSLNQAIYFPVKKWHDTVALRIKKQGGKPYDFCTLELYLGDDVKFKYPASESYINFLGEKQSDLFFFTSRLNDEDAKYITKESIKGANKIVLKAFNHQGKIVATTGLTIEAVYRNIVQGIHKIKTHRVMCDILKQRNHQIKLIFQDSISDGYISRVRKINEYVLPAKVSDL